MSTMNTNYCKFLIFLRFNFASFEAGDAKKKDDRHIHVHGFKLIDKK